MNKRKEARELAVDQTEAMIAAIKAQLEKERAAEAAKKRGKKRKNFSRAAARRKMLRLLKPTQNFVQGGVRTNRG